MYYSAVAQALVSGKKNIPRYTTRYVTVYLYKIKVIAISAFFQLDGRQHGGMACII
jgi:hypothetical protein